jgi:thioredoxin reductase (NADPH)
VGAPKLRKPAGPGGRWDCIIVGGGPAGLSAAIYMGRFRRRTLVVDAGDGRWSYGQVNQNYLGFPNGVGAQRLHSLGRAQAERFGVYFRAATVTGVRATGDGYRLRAGGRTLRARTVVWATGVLDHWPDFAGARRLVGRRLFWCLICDGWRTWRRPVLLLGNDDSAARTALQFLTYTRELTLLVDPARARLSSLSQRKLAARGVEVLRGTVKSVRAPRGDCLAVRLDDGRRLRPSYIFSLLGHTARSDELRHLGLALTPRGHVRVDEDGRTRLPALFAAGDVTDKHTHQVVSAAHEGAVAAQAANQMLYPAAQRLPK